MNKSVNNKTISNNESVYSSIKVDSSINNDDKISFNKKISLNDSLNGSSIRYNSNDNFLHQLYFSDSSSSVSNK